VIGEPGNQTLVWFLTTLFPDPATVKSDREPECQANPPSRMAASKFHANVCQHGGDYQSIFAIARIGLTMIYNS
jgi:hypothetical protein